MDVVNSQMWFTILIKSLKCNFKIFRHTDIYIYIYISSLRGWRGQTSYASINQLHQPQLGLQRGKSILVNFLKLSKNVQNFQKVKKKKKKNLEFFQKFTRNCLPICNPNTNMSEHSLLIVFTWRHALIGTPPGGQNQALLHWPTVIFTQIASSNNVVKRRY